MDKLHNDEHSHPESQFFSPQMSTIFKHFARRVPAPRHLIAVDAPMFHQIAGCMGRFNYRIYHHTSDFE
jgi:hypothetical protein